MNAAKSMISSWKGSVLRSESVAIRRMWRDHLDAVLSQLHIQRIAVIGAIADQVGGHTKKMPQRRKAVDG